MNPFLMALLPSLLGGLGGVIGRRRQPSIDQLFQRGLQSGFNALAPARHSFSVANRQATGAMRQDLQSSLAARGGFSTGAGQVASALSDSAFGMSEASAETQFRQSIAEIAMQQLGTRFADAQGAPGSNLQAGLGGIAGILSRPEFADLLGQIFKNKGSSSAGAQIFHNAGSQ